MSQSRTQSSGEGSSAGARKVPLTRPSVTINAETDAGTTTLSKKKKHRGGRRRKDRRKSFAAPPSETADEERENQPSRPTLLDIPEGSHNHDSFYRLSNKNGSNTSLDSEVLLDHR